MRIQKLFLLMATALIATSVCAKSKSEKLLICGSGWNKIAIVDTETKAIEWEHPTEQGWECNSVASLDNGNVLFAYKKGAKVVTRDHKQVWNIDAPSGCELHTVRLLDNGNCMLAWGGHPLAVLEVNPETGEVISKTEYETGVEKVHGQIRQVNKGIDGNYIIPIVTKSQVHIITPKGDLVRVIDIDGKPFCTERIKNGNYMVACGDGHTLKEVNFETGETIRSIGASDIEGTSLFYVAGLAPQKNGDLYICNWQGHSKDASGPQLIEINKKDQLIWSIDDKENFAKISGICIIK